ncbi:glycosyl hydrolase 53 family protein [Nonomuraea angiospora]|uniref:Arabinogalactan endo-beta-1,4-galactanase n=1 Tax=Nonomuraea angiospora TaxID=46172 RepID=A0ABR9M5P4_9ACTN|nr:glycosyl hydrolase 53 family protein [Nonomuraea angiospora]MBE1588227.1 arabinogalactan endo-1,4-beta-galactosidase [Nonomuraea angiospora]
MRRPLRWTAALAAACLAAALTSPLQPGPAAAAGPNLLANPGFESGSTGWTHTGTSGAAFVQTSSPHSGTSNLAHYSGSAWTANTVQTVTGLTKGTYTFTAWTRNWGVTGAGLQAYNCGDATQSLDLPVSSTWVKVSLAVSVLSTSCTVGIWSNSSTSSLVADDFSFTRITPGNGGTMPVGGDITYRRLNAAVGARYADANGNVKDVLDVLAPKGFNLARIRIYNQPGNPVTYNGATYRLQSGYQDLADAVQNAKAAKARGMKTFISLHYSDFWTNPGLQARPAAWAGYNQTQLENAVYAFTVGALTQLKANGVTPEYVSIGNEINNLLLEVDRFTSPANYYRLLKSASAAVRATSPTSKIAIHLTTPDKWLYSDWVAGAVTNGLDYDVLGVSAYPFWTNMSIASLVNFASWANAMSGKRIMICEVGHPWTLTARGAGEQTLIQGNGLDADGPENYGATPTGQLTYMREYLRAMSDTGKVDAVSYWDPISVDLANGADPNGWVVGGDNEVEDTSFFDYGSPSKALPGLGAFNTW